MPSRDYDQYLAQFSSAKFERLYDAQRHVLEHYAADFTKKRDVAIELPTGAGKTLIALLIASAWREGGKKVAILSANKTLARQMHSEAEALGIPAKLMEGRGTDIPAADLRAYQRAKCVAIMNYWVYLNQNPVVDAADLVIMDDAHLAEHCLHSLFSIEIRKDDHPALFATLAREMLDRFPEYAVLADALNDDAPPTASAELLSFIDQAAFSSRLREIVDAADEGTDFSFRWGRVRGRVNEANIYISRTAFWIRPYVYPLISNGQYEDTTQVLYMSATVGDEGDLSRRLGTRPIVPVPVPAEFAEATSGRRLVVVNRLDDDKDIPDRLASILLAALKVTAKSLWLCSSETEARKYAEVVPEWLKANGIKGHQTWQLTPLGDEIDHFRKAKVGHLFVAGRFDGMDFRDDECRIVVLTTVPRAINLQEEFLTTYLRDSGFMLKRQNQRIVQALGRCNRSDDDYALYLLGDQRFAQYFARDSNREGIAPNVSAEIDMAQDLPERKEKEVIKYVEKFLKGDFTRYDKDIEKYRAEGRPPQQKKPLLATSNEEVVGWAALFDSQNYSAAASEFESCWDKAKAENVMEMCAFHGWTWAKAVFLQSTQGDVGAKKKSFAILEKAISRGGQSSWFNRMRASLGRARADAAAGAEAAKADYAESLLRVFDEKLEKLGATGDKFQRWVDTVTADLSSDKHGQFQQGLESLGSILAFTATRPTYGAATDCRWRGAFGNVREVFTFEAKVEHKSTKIIASDIGQAHNQEARALKEFEKAGYKVRGTIVTHLKELKNDASSSLGTIRVIERDAIVALWTRVATLLSTYRSGWSLDDIGVRSAAAEVIRPQLPATGWLTSALDVANDFVDVDRLLEDWESGT